MKEVVILQLLERGNGEIELTDGRNHIHLNIGSEQDTKTQLLGILSEGGYEADSLHHSHFSFYNFTFRPVWDTEKKDLRVSFDCQNFRLIDAGRPEDGPRHRTFYITYELSKRRMEVLKRQYLASITKQHEEIDMTELIKPTSKAIIDQSRVIEGDLPEVDDCLSPDITFRGDEEFQRPDFSDEDSRAVTPNKADAPAQPASAFVMGQASDAAKENQTTLDPKPADRSGEQTDGGHVMADRSNTIHNEPKKQKITKPKANPTKTLMTEKLDENDLAMIDMELADLADDLDKDMARVKLSHEPLKRGGLSKLADESEILAPQTLGYSFSAFTSEF